MKIIETLPKLNQAKGLFDLTLSFVAQNLLSPTSLGLGLSQSHIQDVQRISQLLVGDGEWR